MSQNVIDWLFAERTPQERTWLRKDLEMDRAAGRAPIILGDFTDSPQCGQAICLRVMPDGSAQLLSHRANYGAVSPVLEEAADIARARGLKRIYCFTRLGDSAIAGLRRQGFEIQAQIAQLCYVLKQQFDNPGEAGAAWTAERKLVNGLTLGGPSLAALIRTTLEGTHDMDATLDSWSECSDEVLLATLSMTESTAEESCALGRWQVVLRQGEPVACILLNLHADRSLEIAYLGVMPRYRRKGLARSLLAYAAARAGQSQVGLLVTAANEHNSPALSLYQKFGFEAYSSFVHQVRVLAEPPRKDVGEIR